MSETPLPTIEISDGVAVVRMDDGKVNTLSTPVLETLETALDTVATEGARALVLLGRPDGAFCAGFDLAEMTSGADGMRALVSRGARFLMRLYGLPVPTVAGTSGHALAAGALTLLACDRRIGTDRPAKIGLNEVAIGMPLPIFGLELARDRLSPAELTIATAGAHIYDPATALGAGYLDRVVPAGEVADTAIEEAHALAQHRSAAYGRTKTELRAATIEGVFASLDEDLATLDAPPSPEP